MLASRGRLHVYLGVTCRDGAQKKDGGWRMCVDYCRLNAVTKFDCFQIPRHDKKLATFAGATVFLSVDLAMAYHQVPRKLADV